MANYYISDLHLGHTRVIEFDNRPFQSIEEMNNTIIHNWNNTVTDNDDVYILGDISLKPKIGLELTQLLKGRKHLILGNHDDLNTQYKSLFVSIDAYAEIKDNGRHVVLSHYPIASWRNMQYGNIHLYGHVHNSEEYKLIEDLKTQMQSIGKPYSAFNVGCMLSYMNYTPRTLDYIIQNYKSEFYL